MVACFDPCFDILPAAQQELWDELAPAPHLGFALYGGTAVALQLGHRESVDFDFFRFAPLDKDELRQQFDFFDRATVVQDSLNTLVVSVATNSGPTKVSFFGGMKIGRVAEPSLTSDRTLLVASLDDLMATKLKAILDRAEIKDYRDIIEMLRDGVSLPKGVVYG